jgi:glutathione S-transferase
MQGQANHFVRYAGEDLPYAKARYRDELRRLYSVLEKHLATTGFLYLVGKKCTIAYRSLGLGHVESLGGSGAGRLSSFVAVGGEDV